MGFPDADRKGARSVTSEPIFPGMDPYVEAPDIWPDFHDALAGRIRALLNESLPPPYYARLQMRPEMGIVLEAGGPHRLVPDVAVVRPPRPDRPAAGTGLLDRPRTMTSEGIQVRVRTDPLKHHLVEIRDAARGHRLVTLLEIVSPSNKRPGPDRRAYEEKQREILESPAHLIELDFLREGKRLFPYPELFALVEKLDCDYLVTLNKSTGRQDKWVDYTLFPVDIREQLPCIPVPLIDPAPDVPLDLQVAARQAYLEGPYRRMLDYSVPPVPPLCEEDREWARGLVETAGAAGHHDGGC
ncbi:MAG: DUF4058 family protein [Planctomycetes bacterium]|nr:DUF4058 family protein [Planctomycetota bacterium]